MVGDDAAEEVGISPGVPQNQNRRPRRAPLLMLGGEPINQVDKLQGRMGHAIFSQCSSNPSRASGNPVDYKDMTAVLPLL